MLVEAKKSTAKEASSIRPAELSNGAKKKPISSALSVSFPLCSKNALIAGLLLLLSA